MDETVTVSKAQYDEMVEKLADATQSKANLIEEIKDLREKKQITEAEADELRKKLEAAPAPVEAQVIDPTKVAELAREEAKKLLSEQEAAAAKANREAALAEFIEKYPEFHPDNDEGGLRFSALQRKLTRFNLDGITAKSDFEAVLEDARNLTVGYTPTSKEVGRDPNPIAPTGSGPAPVKEVKDDTLTSKETQLIEQTFGGDKERYLKIKAKRPDYVATLLEYAR